MTNKKKTDPLFESFYSIYQKKVDKVLAEQRFAKLSAEQKQSCIMDVLRRNAEHEPWREKKFVPSPARYLLREMWKDDVIPYTTKADLQQANEDGSICSRFWTMLIQMYGNQVINGYGETMPKAWQLALRNMTQQQAVRILASLAGEGREFAPTLPKVCLLKRYSVPEKMTRALPRPPQTKKVFNDGFKKLRAILKYR